MTQVEVLCINMEQFPNINASGIWLLLITFILMKKIVGLPNDYIYNFVFYLILWFVYFFIYLTMIIQYFKVSNSRRPQKDDKWWSYDTQERMWPKFHEIYLTVQKI